MNIYDALTKDHDELKPLLDKLVATSEQNEDTRHLLDEIRDALIPHSRAEEAVFYNALREIPASKDIVMNSYKEHMEAEAILRTLRGFEKINVDWTTAARKLRDALFQHIEEEQTRVFEAARQVLLPEEADQLAVAFRRAKQEAMQQGDLKNMAKMIANLMPARFSKGLRDAQVPPA